MDMQCDILISNLKKPETVALMKEKIGDISDGSSPHCAGALKLGFERAFKLKKQGVNVRFQCYRPSCGGYNIPVSYSFVGMKNYCSICRYCLQCTGCKTPRTIISESCQGCRRMFI